MADVTSQIDTAERQTGLAEPGAEALRSGAGMIDPQPPAVRTFRGFIQGKATRALARNICFGARRLTADGPLVSLTFDDVTESAYAIGASILEKYGFRGVFYVSTGLLGRLTPYWRIVDRRAVRDLHRRGHELGLHTRHHQAIGSLTLQELKADIAANHADLREIDDAINATNFAYPYGLMTFRGKRALSQLVETSRSVYPGVNDRIFDPHFIRCVELQETRLGARGLDRCLDLAIRRSGWLVLMTHDIASTPSPYGCTPTFFAKAIEGVVARKIPVVTMKEAMAASIAAGSIWSRSNKRGSSRADDALTHRPWRL